MVISIHLLIHILFALFILYPSRRGSRITGKILRNYKITQIILSIIFFSIHIGALIINPKSVPTIIVIHFFTGGFVAIILELYARRVDKIDLENKIIENNLVYKTPGEIRRILLKKYEGTFSIDEVEKALKRIFRKYK